MGFISDTINYATKINGRYTGISSLNTKKLNIRVILKLYKIIFYIKFIKPVDKINCASGPVGLVSPSIKMSFIDRLLLLKAARRAVR